LYNFLGHGFLSPFEWWCRDSHFTGDFKPCPFLFAKLIAPYRTLIYTTNAIENFNRQLRKVTKTKSAFVSDGARMKILYLATVDISEKRTMPIRNWGTTLDHLVIFFGDRVPVIL
jgi:transposase-like protein